VSDELITPELALVCPELRARAIAELAATQAEVPGLPPTQELPDRAPQARDSAVATARRDGVVARAAGAYLLGRATALLGIAAGITLCVLVLAAVARAVHG
jgi:hypothetical protein